MDPNRRKALDSLVFNVHRNALHCLRYLEGGPASTDEIADHVGISPKTVRSALNDLNVKYVALVNREPRHARAYSDGGLAILGSHKWKLTRAGRAVAHAGNLAHARLVEALDSAVSSQVEAWLTVANNCWLEFDELAQAVASRIPLRPRSTRSSDIDLHLPSAQSPEVLAGNYALYSVCLEGEEIRKGQLLRALPGARDKNTEVIVTGVDRFQVLSRRTTFGNGDSIAADALLSERHQIVVPDGGAVQDYLHMLDPGWRRSVREVRATDLEACLGVLSYGGLESAVMLVHGVDLRRIPDRFAIYDIQGGPDAHAVRGFFHRKGIQNATWSDRERDKWNDIWSTAQQLWHTDRTMIDRGL